MECAHFNLMPFGCEDCGAGPEQVRAALADAGYHPESFDNLDTGEQARIIAEARKQRAESIQ